MQLTHFTDLGLRVLMYLTDEPRATPVTIGEIAERYAVTRNHLVKVVHFMSQQGWLVTTRGKGGGLALARAANLYPLGQGIRQLEGITELIEEWDEEDAEKALLKGKKAPAKAKPKTKKAAPKK